MLPKTITIALQSTDWDQLPQPASNEPGEVEAALRSLSAVAEGESATRVYHRILYAFGNNHAGSYYPVVLWAIPILGGFIQDGTTAARQVTLDVLVDLVGSFFPQRGFETCVDPQGRRVHLASALVQAIEQLRPALLTLLESSRPNAVRKLAEELMEVLDNPAEEREPSTTCR